MNKPHFTLARWLEDFGVPGVLFVLVGLFLGATIGVLAASHSENSISDRLKLLNIAVTALTGMVIALTAYITYRGYLMQQRAEDDREFQKAATCSLEEAEQHLATINSDRRSRPQAQIKSAASRVVTAHSLSEKITNQSAQESIWETQKQYWQSRIWSTLERFSEPQMNEFCQTEPVSKKPDRATVKALLLLGIFIAKGSVEENSLSSTKPDEIRNLFSVAGLEEIQYVVNMWQSLNEGDYEE